MLVVGVLLVLFSAREAECSRFDDAGPTEIVPHMEHAVLISVLADVGGAAETVSCRVRRQGDVDWDMCHDLVSLTPTEFSVTIFGLEAGATYDWELTLSDPDNSGDETASGSFETLPNTPPSPAAAVYVDAARGSDSNDGSSASPFATISRGITAVSVPGGEVVVRAGVYRTSVDISGVSGTAAAPCYLTGERGAVITSAVGALEDGGEGLWTAAGGEVYTTSVTASSVEIVVVNGQRIYHYDTTLSDLTSNAQGVDGGFYFDFETQTLHLKLPDGSDPTGKSVSVGTLDVGVLVDSVSHWVVRGFEIRTFNRAGVDLRIASNCWVQNNTMNQSQTGVSMRKGGDRNVVEYNHIYTNGIYDWPWSSVKAHSGEASGISNGGGYGATIRYNVINGTFNGIYVGSFSEDSDVSIARACVVHSNTILRAGDDGLEPEGACVGVTFDDNVISAVYNAVSLAPITFGPLWIVRTTIDSYTAHAFKVNNGPSGAMLVYHTTAIPSTLDLTLRAITPSIAFGGLTAMNNLFIANSYCVEMSWSDAFLAPVVFDYNAYDCRRDGEAFQWFKWRNTRYAGLAELFAGEGQEEHGIAIPAGTQSFERTPHLLHGAYTPVAASLVLDAAMPINGINAGYRLARVAGEGPDIGAMERGWAYAPPPVLSSSGGTATTAASSTTSSTGGATASASTATTTTTTTTTATTTTTTTTSGGTTTSTTSGTASSGTGTASSTGTGTGTTTSATSVGGDIGHATQASPILLSLLFVAAVQLL